MKQVDMSPEAITKRLRLASDLRDLSISLAKAKPISAERAIELKDQRRRERSIKEQKLP